MSIWKLDKEEFKCENSPWNASLSIVVARCLLQDIPWSAALHVAAECGSFIEQTNGLVT